MTVIRNFCLVLLIMCSLSAGLSPVNSFYAQPDFQNKDYESPYTFELVPSKSILQDASIRITFPIETSFIAGMKCYFGTNTYTLVPCQADPVSSIYSLRITVGQITANSVYNVRIWKIKNPTDMKSLPNFMVETISSEGMVEESLDYEGFPLIDKPPIFKNGQVIYPTKVVIKDTIAGQFKFQSDVFVKSNTKLRFSIDKIIDKNGITCQFTPTSGGTSLNLIAIQTENENVFECQTFNSNFTIGTVYIISVSNVKIDRFEQVLPSFYFELIDVESRSILGFSNIPTGQKSVAKEIVPSNMTVTIDRKSELQSTEQIALTTLKSDSLEEMKIAIKFPEPVLATDKIEFTFQPSDQGLLNKELCQVDVLTGTTCVFKPNSIFIATGVVADAFVSVTFKFLFQTGNTQSKASSLLIKVKDSLNTDALVMIGNLIFTQNTVSGVSDMLRVTFASIMDYNPVSHNYFTIEAHLITPITKTGKVELSIVPQISFGTEDKTLTTYFYGFKEKATPTLTTETTDGFVNSLFTIAAPQSIDTDENSWEKEKPIVLTALPNKDMTMISGFKTPVHAIHYRLHWRMFQTNAITKRVITDFYARVNSLAFTSPTVQVIFPYVSIDSFVRIKVTIPANVDMTTHPNRMVFHITLPTPVFATNLGQTFQNSAVNVFCVGMIGTNVQPIFCNLKAGQLLEVEGFGALPAGSVVQMDFMVTLGSAGSGNVIIKYSDIYDETLVANPLIVCQSSVSVTVSALPALSTPSNLGNNIDLTPNKAATAYDFQFTTTANPIEVAAYYFPSAFVFSETQIVALKCSTTSFCYLIPAVNNIATGAGGNILLFLKGTSVQGTNHNLNTLQRLSDNVAVTVTNPKDKGPYQISVLTADSNLANPETYKIDLNFVKTIATKSIDIVQADYTTAYTGSIYANSLYNFRISYTSLSKLPDGGCIRVDIAGMKIQNDRSIEYQYPCRFKNAVANVNNPSYSCLINVANPAAPYIKITGLGEIPAAAQELAFQLQPSSTSLSVSLRHESSTANDCLTGGDSKLMESFSNLQKTIAYATDQTTMPFIYLSDKHNQPVHKGQTSDIQLQLQQGYNASPLTTIQLVFSAALTKQGGQDVVFCFYNANVATPDWKPITCAEVSSTEYTVTATTEAVGGTSFGTSLFEIKLSTMKSTTLEYKGFNIDQTSNPIKVTANFKEAGGIQRSTQNVYFNFKGQRPVYFHAHAAFHQKGATNLLAFEFKSNLAINAFNHATAPGRIQLGLKQADFGNTLALGLVDSNNVAQTNGYEIPCASFIGTTPTTTPKCRLQYGTTFSYIEVENMNAIANNDVIKIFVYSLKPTNAYPEVSLTITSLTYATNVVVVQLAEQAIITFHDIQGQADQVFAEQFDLTVDASKKLAESAAGKILIPYTTQVSLKKDQYVMVDVADLFTIKEAITLDGAKFSFVFGIPSVKKAFFIVKADVAINAAYNFDITVVTIANTIDLTVSNSATITFYDQGYNLKSIKKSFTTANMKALINAFTATPSIKNKGQATGTLLPYEVPTYSKKIPLDITFKITTGSVTPQDGDHVMIKLGGQSKIYDTCYSLNDNMQNKLGTFNIPCEILNSDTIYLTNLKALTVNVDLILQVFVDTQASAISIVSISLHRGSDKNLQKGVYLLTENAGQQILGAEQGFSISNEQNYDWNHLLRVNDVTDLNFLITLPSNLDNAKSIDILFPSQNVLEDVAAFSSLDKATAILKSQTSDSIYPVYVDLNTANTIKVKTSTTINAGTYQLIISTNQYDANGKKGLVAPSIVGVYRVKFTFDSKVIFMPIEVYPAEFTEFKTKSLFPAKGNINFYLVQFKNVITAATQYLEIVFPLSNSVIKSGTFGSYESTLTILKSAKVNSCTNYLNTQNIIIICSFSSDAISTDITKIFLKTDLVNDNSVGFAPVQVSLKDSKGKKLFYSYDDSSNYQEAATITSSGSTVALATENKEVDKVPFATLDFKCNVDYIAGDFVVVDLGQTSFYTTQDITVTGTDYQSFTSSGSRYVIFEVIKTSAVLAKTTLFDFGTFRNSKGFTDLTSSNIDVYCSYQDVSVLQRYATGNYPARTLAAAPAFAITAISPDLELNKLYNDQFMIKINSIDLTAVNARIILVKLFASYEFTTIATSGTLQCHVLVTSGTVNDCVVSKDTGDNAMLVKVTFNSALSAATALTITFFGAENKFTGGAGAQTVTIYTFSSDPTVTTFVTEPLAGQTALRKTGVTLVTYAATTSPQPITQPFPLILEQNTLYEPVELETGDGNTKTLVKVSFKQLHATAANKVEIIYGGSYFSAIPAEAYAAGDYVGNRLICLVNGVNYPCTHTTGTKTFEITGVSLAQNSVNQIVLGMTHATNPKITDGFPIADGATFDTTYVVKSYNDATLLKTIVTSPQYLKPKFATKFDIFPMHTVLDKFNVFSFVINLGGAPFANNDELRLEFEFENKDVIGTPQKFPDNLGYYTHGQEVPCTLTVGGSNLALVTTMKCWFQQPDLIGRKYPTVIVEGIKVTTAVNDIKLTLIGIKNPNTAIGANDPLIQNEITMKAYRKNGANFEVGLVQKNFFQISKAAQKTYAAGSNKVMVFNGNKYDNNLKVYSKGGTTSHDTGKPYLLVLKDQEVNHCQIKAINAGEQSLVSASYTDFYTSEKYQFYYGAYDQVTGNDYTYPVECLSYKGQFKVLRADSTDNLVIDTIVKDGAAVTSTSWDVTAAAKAGSVGATSSLWDQGRFVKDFASYTQLKLILNDLTDGNKITITQNSVIELLISTTTATSFPVDGLCMVYGPQLTGSPQCRLHLNSVIYITDITSYVNNQAFYVLFPRAAATTDITKVELKLYLNKNLYTIAANQQYDNPVLIKDLSITKAFPAKTNEIDGAVSANNRVSALKLTDNGSNQYTLEGAWTIKEIMKTGGQNLAIKVYFDDNVFVNADTDYVTGAPYAFTATHANLGVDVGKPIGAKSAGYSASMTLEKAVAADIAAAQSITFNLVFKLNTAITLLYQPLFVYFEFTYLGAAAVTEIHSYNTLMIVRNTQIASVDTITATKHTGTSIGLLNFQITTNAALNSGSNLGIGISFENGLYTAHNIQAATNPSCFKKVGCTVNQVTQYCYILDLFDNINLFCSNKQNNIIVPISTTVSATQFNIIIPYYTTKLVGALTKNVYFTILTLQSLTAPSYIFFNSDGYFLSQNAITKNQAFANDQPGTTTAVTKNYKYDGTKTDFIIEIPSVVAGDIIVVDLGYDYTIKLDSGSTPTDFCPVAAGFGFAASCGYSSSSNTGIFYGVVDTGITTVKLHSTAFSLFGTTTNAIATSISIRSLTVFTTAYVRKHADVTTLTVDKTGVAAADEYKYIGSYLTSATITNVYGLAYQGIYRRFKLNLNYQKLNGVNVDKVEIYKTSVLGDDVNGCKAEINGGSASDFYTKNIYCTYASSKITLTFPQAFGSYTTAANIDVYFNVKSFVNTNAFFYSTLQVKETSNVLYRGVGRNGANYDPDTTVVDGYDFSSVQPYKALNLVLTGKYAFSTSFKPGSAAIVNLELSGITASKKARVQIFTQHATNSQQRPEVMEMLVQQDSDTSGAGVLTITNNFVQNREYQINVVIFSGTPSYNGKGLLVKSATYLSDIDTANIAGDVQFTFKSAAPATVEYIKWVKNENNALTFSNIYFTTQKASTKTIMILELDVSGTTIVANNGDYIALHLPKLVQTGTNAFSNIQSDILSSSTKCGISQGGAVYTGSVIHCQMQSNSASNAHIITFSNFQSGTTINWTNLRIALTDITMSAKEDFQVYVQVVKHTAAKVVDNKYYARLRFPSKFTTTIANNAEAGALAIANTDYRQTAQDYTFTGTSFVFTTFDSANKDKVVVTYDDNFSQSNINSFAVKFKTNTLTALFVDYSSRLFIGYLITTGGATSFVISNVNNPLNKLAAHKNIIVNLFRTFQNTITESFVINKDTSYTVSDGTADFTAVNYNQQNDGTFSFSINPNTDSTFIKIESLNANKVTFTSCYGFQALVSATYGTCIVESAYLLKISGFTPANAMKVVVEASITVPGTNNHDFKVHTYKSSSSFAWRSTNTAKVLPLTQVVSFTLVPLFRSYDGGVPLYKKTFAAISLKNRFTFQLLADMANTKKIIASKDQTNFAIAAAPNQFYIPCILDILDTQKSYQAPDQSRKLVKCMYDTNLVEIYPSQLTAGTLVKTPTNKLYMISFFQPVVKIAVTADMNLFFDLDNTIKQKQNVIISNAVPVTIKSLMYTESSKTQNQRNFLKFSFTAFANIDVYATSKTIIEIGFGRQSYEVTLGTSTAPLSLVNGDIYLANYGSIKNTIAAATYQNAFIKGEYITSLSDSKLIYVSSSNTDTFNLEVPFIMNKNENSQPYYSLKVLKLNAGKIQVLADTQIYSNSILDATAPTDNNAVTFTSRVAGTTASLLQFTFNPANNLVTNDVLTIAFDYSVNNLIATGDVAVNDNTNPPVLDVAFMSADKKAVVMMYRLTGGFTASSQTMNVGQFQFVLETKNIPYYVAYSASKLTKGVNAIVNQVITQSTTTDSVVTLFKTTQNPVYQGCFADFEMKINPEANKPIAASSVIEINFGTYLQDDVSIDNDLKCKAFAKTPAAYMGQTIPCKVGSTAFKFELFVPMQIDSPNFINVLFYLKLANHVAATKAITVTIKPVSGNVYNVETKNAPNTNNNFPTDNSQQCATTFKFLEQVPVKGFQMTSYYDFHLKFKTLENLSSPTETKQIRITFPKADAIPGTSTYYAKFRALNPANSGQNMWVPLISTTTVSTASITFDLYPTKGFSVTQIPNIFLAGEYELIVWAQGTQNRGYQLTNLATIGDYHKFTVETLSGNDIKEYGQSWVFVNPLIDTNIVFNVVPTSLVAAQISNYYLTFTNKVQLEDKDYHKIIFEKKDNLLKDMFASITPNALSSTNQTIDCFEKSTNLIQAGNNRLTCFIAQESSQIVIYIAQLKQTTVNQNFQVIIPYLKNGALNAAKTGNYIRYEAYRPCISSISNECVIQRHIKTGAGLDLATPVALGIDETSDGTNNRMISDATAVNTNGAKYTLKFTSAQSVANGDYLLVQVPGTAYMQALPSTIVVDGTNNYKFYVLQRQVGMILVEKTTAGGSTNIVFDLAGLWSAKFLLDAATSVADQRNYAFEVYHFNANAVQKWKRLFQPNIAGGAGNAIVLGTITFGTLKELRSSRVGDLANGNTFQNLRNQLSLRITGTLKTSATQSFIVSVSPSYFTSAYCQAKQWLVAAPTSASSFIMLNCYSLTSSSFKVEFYKGTQGIVYATNFPIDLTFYLTSSTTNTFVITVKSFGADSQANIDSSSTTAQNQVLDPSPLYSRVMFKQLPFPERRPQFADINYEVLIGYNPKVTTSNNKLKVLLPLDFLLVNNNVVTQSQITLACTSVLHLNNYVNPSVVANQDQTNKITSIDISSGSVSTGYNVFIVNQVGNTFIKTPLFASDGYFMKAELYNGATLIEVTESTELLVLGAIGVKGPSPSAISFTNIADASNTGGAFQVFQFTVNTYALSKGYDDGTNDYTNIVVTFSKASGYTNDLLSGLTADANGVMPFVPCTHLAGLTFDTGRAIICTLTLGTTTTDPYITISNYQGLAAGVIVKFGIFGIHGTPAGATNIGSFGITIKYIEKTTHKLVSTQLHQNGDFHRLTYTNPLNTVTAEAGTASAAQVITFEGSQDLEGTFNINFGITNLNLPVGGYITISGLNDQMFDIEASTLSLSGITGTLWLMNDKKSIVIEITTNTFTATTFKIQGFKNPKYKVDLNYNIVLTSLKSNKYDKKFTYTGIRQVSPKTTATVFTKEITKIGNQNYQDMKFTIKSTETLTSKAMIEIKFNIQTYGDMLIMKNTCSLTNFPTATTCTFSQYSVLIKLNSGTWDRSKDSIIVIKDLNTPNVQTSNPDGTFTIFYDEVTSHVVSLLFFSHIFTVSPLETIDFTITPYYNSLNIYTPMTFKFVCTQNIRKASTLYIQLPSSFNFNMGSLATQDFNCEHISGVYFNDKRCKFLFIGNVLNMIINLESNSQQISTFEFMIKDLRTPLTQDSFDFTAYLMCRTLKYAEAKKITMTYIDSTIKHKYPSISINHYPFSPSVDGVYYFQQELYQTNNENPQTIDILFPNSFHSDLSFSPPLCYGSVIEKTLSITTRSQAFANLGNKVKVNCVATQRILRLSDVSEVYAQQLSNTSAILNYKVVFEIQNIFNPSSSQIKVDLDKTFTTTLLRMINGTLSVTQQFRQIYQGSYIYYPYDLQIKSFQTSNKNIRSNSDLKMELQAQTANLTGFIGNFRTDFSGIYSQQESNTIFSCNSSLSPFNQKCNRQGLEMLLYTTTDILTTNSFSLNLYNITNPIDQFSCGKKDTIKVIVESDSGKEVYYKNFMITNKISACVTYNSLLFEITKSFVGVKTLYPAASYKMSLSINTFAVSLKITPVSSLAGVIFNPSVIDFSNKNILTQEFEILIPVTAKVGQLIVSFTKEDPFGSFTPALPETFSIASLQQKPATIINIADSLIFTNGAPSFIKIYADTFPVLEIKVKIDQISNSQITNQTDTVVLNEKVKEGLVKLQAPKNITQSVTINFTLSYNTTFGVYYNLSKNTYTFNVQPASQSTQQVYTKPQISFERIHSVGKNYVNVKGVVDVFGKILYIIGYGGDATKLQVPKLENFKNRLLLVKGEVKRGQLNTTFNTSNFDFDLNVTRIEANTSYYIWFVAFDSAQYSDIKQFNFTTQSLSPGYIFGLVVASNATYSTFTAQLPTIFAVSSELICDLPTDFNMSGYAIISAPANYTIHRYVLSPDPLNDDITPKNKLDQLNTQVGKDRIKKFIPEFLDSSNIEINLLLYNIPNILPNTIRLYDGSYDFLGVQMTLDRQGGCYCMRQELPNDNCENSDNSNFQKLSLNQALRGLDSQNIKGTVYSYSYGITDSNKVCKMKINDVKIKKAYKLYCTGGVYVKCGSSFLGSTFTEHCVETIKSVQYYSKPNGIGL